MKKVLKKTAILVVGWIFILLGIAGMFLPILQGFLFLFVGLIILSYESETARRLIRSLRKRFPRVAETMDKAELRAKNTWSRVTGRGAAKE